MFESFFPYCETWNKQNRYIQKAKFCGTLPYTVLKTQFNNFNWNHIFQLHDVVYLSLLYNNKIKKKKKRPAKQASHSHPQHLGSSPHGWFFFFLEKKPTWLVVTHTRREITLHPNVGGKFSILFCPKAQTCFAKFEPHISLSQIKRL